MEYRDTQLEKDIVVELISDHGEQEWQVIDAETGAELETITRRQYNLRQSTERYI